MYRLPLLLALTLTGTACQAQSGAPTTPSTGKHAVYLATKKIGSETALPDPKAIASPAIDGVFIRIPWDKIQPAPDRNDWSLLDTITRPAVAAHKSLSIAVITGERTPTWLAREGVPFVKMTVGARKRCDVVDAAAVWSPQYVRAYVRMIDAMKRHLVETGAYDSVRIVKFSGIATHSIELRLPKNNACSSTVDQQWVDAGYRPSRVVAAWRDMATGIDRAFPNRLLVQTILRKQGFPAIDDNGKIVGNRQDRTGDAIVSACIEMFKARCGVQWTALNLNGPMAPRVTEAHRRGATIGWQANLYEGNSVGSGCQNNRRVATITCTAPDYEKLIRRGFDLGGSFIEVWQPDVLRFPDAILAAKRKS